MHPRWEILEKLQNKHKWVRLGWYEKKSGEGTFALIQLYHISDAMRSFIQRWEDRGPIYGKPFDRLSRIPMWVKDIEPIDVFSGRVLEYLDEWTQPMADRIRSSEESCWRDLDFKLNDLAEEAGDYVWHHNKKTGDNPGNTAKKFMTKEEKQLLSGDRDKSKDKAAIVQKTPVGAVPMR